MIGLSLLEIIEMFHSADVKYDDLAPVTSHSIETLKKAAELRASMGEIKSSEKISQIIDDSEDLIKSNDLGNKEDKMINKDEPEKSMNVSIFKSTMEKLVGKLKSVGSSIGSASAAVSGAIGGASERMSKIMKRALLGKPQAPEQPQGQAQGQAEAPGQIQAPEEKKSFAQRMLDRMRNKNQ
jgi:hypothetical protein